MSKAITVLLVMIGLINFTPIMGVISTDILEAGYGIPMDGQELPILMRHRALLFGIIGGFTLYAAFKRVYHLPALIMSSVSMWGFSYLALTIGGYNDEVAKVLFFDLLGIPLSIATAVLMWLRFKNEQSGAH